jgi:hypothetical protein
MENTTEPLPTDRHPLGFWLRAVDGLITREFAAAFDGEPVDRRDWMILNALDGSVDESLAERVRERLARRPKRLVRLAELGWIASSEGRWTLTEEGRAAKDRLASRVDDVRRRVAGAVSDEDFATTRRTLEAIARDLGGDDPQALRAAARGPRGFGRHGHGHRRNRNHGHGHGFGHGQGHGFGHGHGYGHGHQEHEGHGGHEGRGAFGHEDHGGFGPHAHHGFGPRAHHGFGPRAHRDC